MQKLHRENLRCIHLRKVKPLNFAQVKNGPNKHRNRKNRFIKYFVDKRFVEIFHLKSHSVFLDTNENNYMTVIIF